MIWIKKNGKEIDANDNEATTAYALSLGWKRKVDKPAKVKKSKPVEE